MEDFSFVSDINEKLRECGVWAFSFKGNKRVIVHHDGETMSVRSTRTRANSRIDMLTDMLLDETPDIDSDFKDFLVVHPTEVFLVKERNGVYVSVYLRNKTPNSLVSARVMLSLLSRSKVNYAKPFAKAGLTAFSTEGVPHFIDVIHMQLLFPQ